jgi:hypothetical protein
MVDAGGVAFSEQAVVEKMLADNSKASGKKVVHFISWLLCDFRRVGNFAYGHNFTAWADKTYPPYPAISTTYSIGTMPEYLGLENKKSH